MAGSSPTHFHHMAANRYQPEALVKCDYPINRSLRHTGEISYLQECLGRDLAKRVLHLLQNGDYLMLLTGKGVADLIHYLRQSEIILRERFKSDRR